MEKEREREREMEKERERGREKGESERERGGFLRKNNQKSSLIRYENAVLRNCCQSFVRKHNLKEMKLPSKTLQNDQLLGSTLAATYPLG